jgi:hypothetical protein
VHQRRQRHADDGEITDAISDLLGLCDGAIGMEPATASHGREEHVLVGPHDPLGHPRGTTSVEYKQVVVGAVGKIALT